MKKIFKIAILGSFSVLLTSCSQLLDVDDAGSKADVVSKDKNINEGNTVKTFDLKNNIEVNDDIISLNTYYTFPANRVSNWYFTVPTNINLEIQTDQYDAEKYDVMINNVYSEVSVHSSKQIVAGIRQDSMNLNYNSFPGGGITIDEKNSFNIPFNVEGINQSELHIGMYGGYGSGSSSRITESDIRYYAEGGTLSAVWSILVKDKKTGKHYVKTIQDFVGLGV